jgi:thiamine-monophosphate kinase
MEAALLAWLKKSLPQGGQFLVGLGDDAAVLQWQERSNCVVTSDLLADGTHFQLGQHTLAQIGRKLAAVNLSDLAAMAAEPLGLVVSLLLPDTMTLAQVQDIYAGMLPLCEEFDFRIAGGDTNVWSGNLVVSATAFGACPRSPLTRNGAELNDLLLVTGSLGGSLAGQHLDFTPRVREALLLNERYKIHAAMDISDGLALDAARLGEASGLGVVIDLPSVPISTAAHEITAADADGRSALERALADGEDFELLIAVPADEAGRLLSDQPLDIPLTQIGCFVREPGLWQSSQAGDQTPLPRTGYQHGSQAEASEA